MKGDVSTPQFLAFIWGAIFAGGIYAVGQTAALALAWATPPTVADFVGTLAFSAVAIILLTPAIFVLIEIAQGRFSALVEEAQSESGPP